MMGFKIVDIFIIHLLRWQNSRFNLVKVHNMKHYAGAICWSKALVEYNSNMFEHLHIAMVKTGYQTSNKKNFLDHIVKYNQRLEALRTSASEIDGCYHSIGKNMTLERKGM